jgi:hypothetical protein
MYRSSSEAQKRVDRIEAFNKELDTLKDEGILSLNNSQYNSIFNYHTDLIKSLSQEFSINKTHKDKQLSLGMKISSFLGALALSSSLFFFFYQFWTYFPLYIQVAILTLSPLFLLAITAIVSYRDSSGYFTKIVASLTIVSFVLDISILGHIFSIVPSQNTLFIISLLSFALAYATNTRLILSFGIIALASFISAQMGTIGGMYWMGFGYRPENFFLPAFILFITPSLFSHTRYDGFDPIYRVFAMLLFFLPVLILSNWGGGSYLPMINHNIEMFYQTVGFVVSATAIWFGVKRGYSEVVNSGNTFFILFLYTKFYDWWWEMMPKYIFFLIIGITSLLFLILFRVIKKRGETA